MGLNFTKNNQLSEKEKLELSVFLFEKILDLTNTKIPSLETGLCRQYTNFEIISQKEFFQAEDFESIEDIVKIASDRFANVDYLDLKKYLYTIPEKFSELDLELELELNSLRLEKLYNTYIQHIDQHNNLLEGIKKNNSFIASIKTAVASIPSPPKIGAILTKTMAEEILKWRRGVVVQEEEIKSKIGKIKILNEPEPQRQLVQRAEKLLREKSEQLFRILLNIKSIQASSEEQIEIEEIIKKLGMLSGWDSRIALYLRKVLESNSNVANKGGDDNQKAPSDAKTPPQTEKPLPSFPNKNFYLYFIEIINALKNFFIAVITLITGKGAPSAAEKSDQNSSCSFLSSVYNLESREDVPHENYKFTQPIFTK